MVNRALALTAGLAVAAVGCGGGSAPESGSKAPDAHKLKVALVVPGLTNDGSFNQVAREAVERLDQEGRIDADIREKLSDRPLSSR